MSLVRMHAFARANIMLAHPPVPYPLGLSLGPDPDRMENQAGRVTWCGNLAEQLFIPRGHVQMSSNFVRCRKPVKSLDLAARDDCRNQG
jgi:hypothetical protein